MGRYDVAIDDADCSCVTVSIKGRFDYRLFQSFDEIFSRAFSWDNKVTIDLSDTEYLDSCALGLLLLLRDNVDKMTTIFLENPVPDVKRVLTTANFDKLFVIEDQLESA